ncbi:hypothetical protein BS78_02G051500 [Paspalum vaginatum]|nr:hypothetical protein BS78_02G051500 [Paspalum vaginatum]
MQHMLVTTRQQNYAIGPCHNFILQSTMKSKSTQVCNFFLSTRSATTNHLTNANGTIDELHEIQTTIWQVHQESSSNMIINIQRKSVVAVAYRKLWPSCIYVY